MKRSLACLGIILAACILTGRPASAVVYTFSGACADCVGPVSAQLTLADDYVPGSPITLGNFVSFTYDGSDKLLPFTIPSNNICTGPFGADLVCVDSTPFLPVVQVSGSIPAVLPALAQFSVSESIGVFTDLEADSSPVSGPLVFRSLLNGTWCAGVNCLGDYGRPGSGV